MAAGIKITAGTRTSAELCGVDDTLGTLEVGKIADVVVVKGNRGGFAV